MDLLLDGLERDGPALLALDEALVRAGPARPILRPWVNPPAVVVGRHQDVGREVALRACAEDGVPVLRRASGGGTVYHDLGTLNVALVLPGRRTDAVDHLAALLLRVLHELGLPVERRSRGLFVGPVKLAGFAGLQTRPGTLAHASVLVATDPAAVGRYLAPAPGRPAPARLAPGAGHVAAPPRRRRHRPGAGRDPAHPGGRGRHRAGADAGRVGGARAAAGEPLPRHRVAPDRQPIFSDRSDEGGSMDDSLRMNLYRTMVLIRVFEEAILREYHADKRPAFDIGAGQVPGEMHLSAGQEPVAAGVCAHLTAEDAVTATHRPHHLAIAHGVDLEKLAAEIFGRETGLGRGRGGHMHLFDPDTHFSCSGIIAEGYPPALGQAFAFRRRGTDRIAVAVTGEGAANQGAFHESLNLAALWRLPVVFVVEDNDWGISVPRSASTCVTSNAIRAAGYDMPGERVEDNSVEAVYEAAGRAVARARAGEGPSLLEVHTLRMWGHFEGDAQAYRTDLEGVPGRDPIATYEHALRSAGLLDDGHVKTINEEAVARVEAAIAFAKNSPEPAPETATDYVFA